MKRRNIQDDILLYAHKHLSLSKSCLQEFELGVCFGLSATAIVYRALKFLMILNVHLRVFVWQTEGIH